MANNFCDWCGKEIGEGRVTGVFLGDAVASRLPVGYEGKEFCNGACMRHWASENLGPEVGG
jgi:hypothetical protein